MTIEEKVVILEKNIDELIVVCLKQTETIAKLTVYVDKLTQMIILNN